MGRRKGSIPLKIGDTLELTGEQLTKRIAAIQNSKAKARALRFGALNALGGMCESCGETMPSMLQVRAKGIAKEWSHYVLYRRVAEDPEPRNLANLLCSLCVYLGPKQIKLSKREAKELDGRNSHLKPLKYTGQTFWIAGELVQEVRNKVGFHNGVQFVRSFKYDLGDPEAGPDKLDQDALRLMPSLA